MNFGAMAAWQAWLIIGAAVAAAVALFLIKIKPPQILIPSLTLWSRVLGEQREQTLWERIRKAVSLAIVALITLALALAILRPQRTPRVEPGPGTRSEAGTQNPDRGTTGSRVSIVIDSSWSMLAQTSGGDTRWDRAVARARTLAASAAGDDIVLSTTADGVVEGPTPDVALIEAALDRIAPSGSDAAAWPRVEGTRVTYFLTDGAVARPLDPDVQVESVFEEAANVAITAFDVRPGLTLESAGQAYLEVANYASAPQDVRIVLTRGAVSVLDVHVTLAAGEAAQRVVPLDRGGDARLRARISAPKNALVVDDEAFAWIPGATPVAVTVVSDHGASFGPLFSKDPDVKATFVTAAGYTPGQEDVVIFDRVLPKTAPQVPALFIAPAGAPPENSWLRRSGRPEDKPQWAPGGFHPILRGVDTQTMALDRAQPYEGSASPVAFSAAGTPLIYVRDVADQRVAVFTFSVTDSKLMFAPGFPVLFGNAIDWLVHPVPAGARRPGRAQFAGSILSITGPDAKPVPVTEVSGTSIATLSRVGFYTVASGGAASVIAVNAGDPDTSDLRRTRLPEAARADTASAPSRGRPWWLYAAVLALLLVAAEWFTWQRRITV